MMSILSGMGFLLLTLALFSVFSLKFPKGSQAMSGMADAAVASFLIEAVHKYISGDLVGIAFLGTVGEVAGGLSGVAAAIMVPIRMGVNPVFAVVAGLACGGYGILPGFIAGYIIGLIAPYIEKYLPAGLDLIGGALVVAPAARVIAMVCEPAVNSALGTIGVTITAAASQSPLIMGFLLGGIMKMVCTSPLSSMALTAMLGLTGLPMGIASVACFGGAFSNGIVFYEMGYGDKSNAIAVALEPLTQAPIVTAHPIPIFTSSFVGGALSGVVAAVLGIVNNAPGTASSIPGLIAPFGFNEPRTVIIAMALAGMCGTAGGWVCGRVFKRFSKREQAAQPAEAPASTSIFARFKQRRSKMDEAA